MSYSFWYSKNWPNSESKSRNIIKKKPYKNLLNECLSFEFQCSEQYNYEQLKKGPLIAKNPFAAWASYIAFGT